MEFIYWDEPEEEDIKPKYFIINKSNPLYKDLIFCNLFPHIDFLDNPENLPPDGNRRNNLWTRI
jgi:hypothetical protein